MQLVEGQLRREAPAKCKCIYDFEHKYVLFMGFTYETTVYFTCTYSKHTLMDSFIENRPFCRLCVIVIVLW